MKKVETMKSGLMVVPLAILTLTLGACSDPDFTEMCLQAVAKEIPKEATFDVTKHKVTKQGLSATVYLSITSVIKQKDKDDKITKYNASCIVKSDRVARSFLRPVAG
ncbi:MAG: hypothetical protein HOF23_03650 [Rhodospirillaceae bacterium]|nr:hypothetical protein [Rhodospirillaceae bacterium]